MKILFFAPHSAVWDFAFPEALVASTLKNSGHDIFYITCGQVFNEYCISMAAANLRFDASQQEKKKICIQCQATKKLLKNNFSFSGSDLSDVLTISDFENTEHLLSQITRQNFYSFELDAVPLGRIALYEVIIHFKKINLIFTDEEWLQYKAALKNTILSFLAAQKIIQNIKPDIVISYGSLYSVNHVWRVMAEKSGATPYLIQGAGSFAEIKTRMNIVVDRAKSGLPYYSDMLVKWPIFRDHPTTPEAIESVTKHFIHLFTGGDYVYSPQKAGTRVRDRYGIKNSQKLFVATMSSYDEIFAAEAVGFLQFSEDILFKDQVNWIHSLIEYFKNKPDYFLLIRPHPREYGVFQNGVLSDGAKKFQEAINVLPENIAVNWPKHGISLYDIAEEADVFLNGWSTVGSEMPLLGIPVVSYTDVGWYPPDLNYIGKTKAEYFSAIERAVAEGWNEQRILVAFRWFSLIFYWSTIDFSESIKPKLKGAKKILIGSALKEPAWFLGFVFEKISSFFFSSMSRTSFLRRECKNSALNETAAGEVEFLFANQSRSLLDSRLKKIAVTDAAAEILAIKNAMFKICAAMTGGRNDVSPLRSKLKRFYESK